MIKTITNRGTFVFNDITRQFNDYLSKNNLSPSKSILLYWDNYGSNNYLLDDDPDKYITNIIREHTNYIADKKKCSNLVRELNLNQHYPLTFNNKNELIYKNENSIYFLKEKFGTMCIGVECISYKNLKNLIIPSNKVIQEGIVNIKLINQKKFVIRCYIIIYNKNIYLSKYAYCAIFNKNFDSSKTDPNIQVCEPKERHFLELHQSEYSNYIFKIRDALKYMRPLFDPIVKQSSETKYTIIGPDVLITSDNKIKFIEFNSFPNLHHSSMNKNVIDKMLLDLYKLVFFNIKLDNMMLV